MTQEEPRSGSMSMRRRLFFSLLFFGPAIYFNMDGDPVTAAVCVAAGLAAFGGYRAGAASMLALLGATAAAIAYAPSIGLANEWRISQWFGTTGLTNRALSVGLVGLLIAVLIVVIVTIVLRRLFARRPGLEVADRWIGFSFGALEGVLAMAFFLGGLLVIEPIERQSRDQRDSSDTRGQAVSRFILLTTAKTRESQIGPTLTQYNPFTRIPSLNKMEEIQQSVRVLGDPANIQELLQHPSIQQLQARPEMRRAMDELQNDPQIQEILNSGNPMNRQAIIALMNHPAVLQVIDQPGFLQEAADVVRATAVVPAIQN